MDKIVIDIDSAYTNIYKIGYGIVLSEPTVATVDVSEDRLSIKAVGTEARKLIGKTSGKTKVVFPVFEGEIVNVDVATELLKVFLKKIEFKRSIFGGEVIVSVPCGITAEMLAKYKKVMKNVGITKAYYIEAPILAALGQRVPLSDSRPCFLIDMASGVTNIAALSLDGIIAGLSINFGSNKISTDLIDYIAQKYNLQIGLLTAERIKNEIAGLVENDALSTIVNGRDISTGSPRSINIRAMDILTPIRNYFDSIAEISKSLLVKLPPEVSAEIRHVGLYLSGATSSVYGLEDYFTKIFDMKINIPENGAMSVVLGGGVLLGKKDLAKKLCINK